MNVKKTIVLRDDQFKYLMKLIPQLMTKPEQSWNISKIIRCILDESKRKGLTVEQLIKAEERGIKS